MTTKGDASALTLNRLSLYLRVLNSLQEAGVGSVVSSQELADQLRLTAAQIRKDLAQFGEFGIRGVGYDVDQLARRLTSVLGLESRHPVCIMGMGNLGQALTRSPGFNSEGFEVVAGFDNDPEKIGSRIGNLVVQDPSEMERVIAQRHIEIGVLTVPVESAQQNYDELIDAGARAILNFAPVRLRERPGIRTKNVDLRIDLEELSFFLATES